MVFTILEGLREVDEILKSGCADYVYEDNTDSESDDSSDSDSDG
jgi:hypothetical protein